MRLILCNFIDFNTKMHLLSKFLCNFAPSIDNYSYVTIKLKSYERNEEVFWFRIIGSAHYSLSNIQLFTRRVLWFYH